MIFDPTVWCYGFAALIFAAFAGRLLIGWNTGARTLLVFSAALASTLWALCVLVSTYLESSAWWSFARGLDVIRVSAWLLFLLNLLGVWHRKALPDRAVSLWLMGLTGIVLAAFLFPPGPPWQAGASERGTSVEFLILLGISIVGLTLTEQLYRRTPEERQWAIKPLIVGLSGMFAFDLLLYAEAVLFNYLDAGMWAARGVAHAFVVFFVAIATARNTAWTIDLHVSRGLVFQSTAVMIAGVCLLLVAAAGYWVRAFGGGWGATLQIAFVFAATLCIAALSLSGSLRSRLRLFINKNLFSYRYDYRKEWLRFTEVLGTSETAEKLHERVIKSIAELVECVGGAVWLERAGMYCQVARLNTPEITAVEPLASEFSRFLHDTGWVLQLDEVRTSKDRFAGLALPDWMGSIPNAWLVVPLPNGASTIGFVLLTRPLAPVDINWEVRDLLKTASRQAASYLAQFRANEELLEAEKFNAFNRMSAFVVHDLKNLISQLALLLRNAERHRDNPEFQRDMLETIEHVVQRMTHLTRQLHTGAAPASKPWPVDLGEIISRVVDGKKHYPVAVIVESGATVRALAHEENIERVIGHIVQNAIDATLDHSQPVTVRIGSENGHAVVEVQDHGTGMSEEFIREKLFRPFQTTKPAGMGVGMNESYQYISGIGGRIQVKSEVGEGSNFRVLLRLVRDPEPPNNGN